MKAAPLGKEAEVVLTQLFTSTKPGADLGFGQGGPQLPRPKVANLVKQSHVNPGSFQVFNAQICILLHFRDSFSLILTASSTSKIRHYIAFYIFMKNCLFNCVT